MGRLTAAARRVTAATRDPAATAPARQGTGRLRNGLELLLVRQVFETWWISVPPEFEETWVEEGAYWHAWDRHRSVSVSSTVLTDDAGRPAPPDEVMAMVGAAIEGEPVEGGPPGLLSRAAIIRTDRGSRASRALSGMIVVEGRVLVATIASDDIDWAVRIWTSIGYRPSPVPNRAARRAQRHRLPRRLD